MSVLTATEISVGYGSRIILENQSVVFSKPEIVSIIGPNGSGKSTLLKALARLISVKAGSIQLNQVPLRSWNTKKLAQHIALLPQMTTAPDGMLVEQLVRTGRTPYVSMFKELSDHDLSVVESAMKATDVWCYRHQQVGALSGGERQRVWLALALAQEPQILLLDEPTTYLDSRHQIELMELIKGVQQKRNMMVIMVMHDLNLALRYSHRIIAIKDGAIVGDGEPQAMMTSDHLAEWFGVKSHIIASPDEHDNSLICVPYGLA